MLEALNAHPYLAGCCRGAAITRAPDDYDLRDDGDGSQQRPATRIDKGKFLDPQGLKGACIGIARNYFGYHEVVDALINQSIAVMKEQGAVIVDPANVDTAGKFGGCEVTTFLYELKADLAKYLQERYDESLEDCGRTVERMSCHFGAWAGMGHCHAHSGRLAEAAECYKKALSINPGFAGINQALAEISKRCG